MAENLDMELARQRASELLVAGRPQDALRYIEKLEGLHPFEFEQLLAMTELEAGEQLADRTVIARGVDRFERLGQQGHDGVFIYNRANGYLALWQVAVKNLGVSQALLAHREDLQQARDLFAAVGADTSVAADDRCQALTNRGNSLDSCGRHIEAIAAYDEALAIQPSFGMALGNRGMTLLWRAAADETHRHALTSEAVASLDAALSDPDDVMRYGGVGALESFKKQRGLIPDTPTHHHDHAPLDDPYLQWCRDRQLFLHASHPCVGPNTKVLDAVRFGGMTVGIDDDAQQRLRTLQDALNSLLQDYVAVRYLTWISTEPGTPVREHAAEISERASFTDSLTYAKWGVATGLSVNALAAATNLLDKIASVSHLYLGTERKPSSVHFRAFWLEPRKKNVPPRVDRTIADELDNGNPGLLALCDLAGELERPTPLNELIGRRHAATHRTVAVHHMLLDEIDDGGWLDRIAFDDLRDALLAQLHRARAALFNLSDLISVRETRIKPDGPLPSLPAWPAQPERADDW
jgi:tetratricopeptide (TPR) repeat protein